MTHKAGVGIFAFLLIGILCGIGLDYLFLRENNSTDIANIEKLIKANMQDPIPKIILSIIPSVVHIDVKKIVEDIDGNPNDSSKEKKEIIASGVIFDEKGDIITNNHVIKGAASITIKLFDGRMFSADFVGGDELSDVAIIRIKGNLSPGIFKPVVFGDSDEIRVGESVIAIGNPLGLDCSVTKGIISATGRMSDINSYEDFIQTDAAINEGNSGGPLVNLNGEVIGITSVMVKNGYSYSGLGFAIPSNMVKWCAEQIIEKGKIRRSFFGIAIERGDVSTAKSKQRGHSYGAYISNVVKGSPAARAGILAGDLVIEYGGKKIENGRKLFIAIGHTEPGTKVRLKIVRNNKEVELEVITADRSQYVLPK